MEVALYRKCILSGDFTRYFDLHCDTPYECYIKKQDFNKNSLAVSGEQGDIFDRWRQCFAIWIRDDAERPFELYRNIYADFKGKTGFDSSNAQHILTVEGGSLIEDKIERVETIYNDGIKVLTLTWNGENRIAGGVDSDCGLSAFGAQVIGEMNRLKISCDLSHLNDKSFFDVLDKTQYPVVTHTGCRAVVNHKRNLSDEQIKEIAKRGSVIGICFYPNFIGEDVFEGVYRNIYYICDMGFENNLAFGSDFDGAQMSRQLDKISKIPQLYAFLEQKGLKKPLLDKIFYNNAKKFFVSL